MLRVLHVPSHLTYARQLAAETFAPVPGPTGRALRIDELFEVESWDFFDVLHIHSVELATVADVARLVRRLDEAGKRLIVTMHDLTPNIDIDDRHFCEKARLVLRAASAALTLTSAAARRLAESGAPSQPLQVVPHGAAVPPGMVTSPHRQARGLAAFGALRPNRDIVGLVRAWRLLPVVGRPLLRLLLRSVTKTEERRYAQDLAELKDAAAAEPGIYLTIRSGLASAHDLVAWCRASAVLVLPYRRITHSGQLELARDMGMAAVAPELATVRSQLTDTDDPDYPVHWVPPEELDNPTLYAQHLAEAADSVGRRPREIDDWRNYRTVEYRRLLARHEMFYSSGGPAPAGN